MAVKKVILNGTPIIDLSNTTAVASDVAEGKYFYLSNGTRTVGTNRGTTNSDITITREAGYNEVDVLDNSSQRFMIKTSDSYTPTQLTTISEKTNIENIQTVIQYDINDTLVGYHGVQTIYENVVNCSSYFPPLSKEIYSSAQYKVVNSNNEDITSAYFNGDYQYYVAYNTYTIDSQATTTLQQTYINQIPNDYSENDKEKLTQQIQNEIKAYVIVFRLTDQAIVTPPQPSENTLNFVGLWQLTFTPGETWGQWASGDTGVSYGSFSVIDPMIVYSAPTGDNTSMNLIVLGANPSSVIVAGDYYLVPQYQPTVSGEPSSDPSLYTFTVNGQTYKATPNSTFTEWVASAYNNSGYTITDDMVTTIAFPGTTTQMPVAVATLAGPVSASTYTFENDNENFYLVLTPPNA